MAMRKLTLEKKGVSKRGESYVTKAELIKELGDIEERLETN